MSSRWSAEEIQNVVKQLSPWYHKIDLGEGIVTPGYDFDAIWNIIRKTRDSLSYDNKTVLDIASFDGMWAFEAETLGAKTVVATDCYYETYKKFLFCRDVLNSNVIPYYNVSPYNVYERLDVFFQEDLSGTKPYERLFDIVQHLGLLYHLREPFLSLSQARSVLKAEGYLLIETAVVVDETSSYMMFNGIPSPEPRIYDDPTTWWAPTILCLKEMLKASLFEPIEETIQILDKSQKISRMSLVAQAVSSNNADETLLKELSRTYRNPGLVTAHL